MQGQALARFIIGVVGNVVSAFLFLSPAPTFKGIIRKKDTEEFHPYPYLAALMNCMMGVFYGLPFVHPDSTLVWTINGFGFIAEVFYLVIFFYYTNSKNRKVILGVVLVELLVLGAIVAGTLIGLDTTTSRSRLVGILCVLFGLIMYGSPFSNVITVCKTKSSEFMPFYLILVGTAKGLIWFAYAFLKEIDPNIAVGNGIGALFGIFQLGLYVYYRDKEGNKKEV